ncbi:hypothetical protein K474DRAFT_464488 [Panus rudis PR-1116 ss-1]|nr:hypothetical protein K474DRAFT_464488 [Panus rudis PR-1116 ss-1]
MTVKSWKIVACRMLSRKTVTRKVAPRKELCRKRVIMPRIKRKRGSIGRIFRATSHQIEDSDDTLSTSSASVRRTLFNIGPSPPASSSRSTPIEDDSYSDRSTYLSPPTSPPPPPIICRAPGIESAKTLDASSRMSLIFSPFEDLHGEVSPCSSCSLRTPSYLRPRLPAESFTFPSSHRPPTRHNRKCKYTFETYPPYWTYQTRYDLDSNPLRSGLLYPVDWDTEAD